MSTIMNTRLWRGNEPGIAAQEPVLRVLDEMTAVTRVRISPASSRAGARLASLPTSTCDDFCQATTVHAHERSSVGGSI